MPESTDTPGAMSQENVQWWLQSTEAWSRGDRDAWLRSLPPDWTFETSGVFPGLKSTYRGVQGAEELWDTMRGPWKTFEIVVRRVEDLGETLLALVTFRVEGRDGVQTSRDWAYIVNFNQGTATRTDNFATWEKALEAAGLSE